MGRPPADARGDPAPGCVLASIFTGAQGRKARTTGLVRNAGVPILSVQRDELPDKDVTVEGTVVRTDRPPSAARMLAVVRRSPPEEAARGFVDAELERPAPSSCWSRPGGTAG